MESLDLGSLGEVALAYMGVIVAQYVRNAVIGYFFPRKRLQTEEPEVAPCNESSNLRKRMRLDVKETLPFALGETHHEEDVFAAKQHEEKEEAFTAMQHEENEEVCADTQSIAESDQEEESLFATTQSATESDQEEEEEEICMATQSAAEGNEKEEILMATQRVAENDQEEEEAFCATQLVVETEDEEEDNPEAPLEATQWANDESALIEEAPIMQDTPPPHEVIEISDDEEEEEEYPLPSRMEIVQAMENPNSSESKLILQ